MESLEEIFAKIESLKNDFENGSSAIAMEGLKIFCDAVGFLNNIDITDEKEKYYSISDFAQRIIDAKPAMPAIKNIIHSALNELSSKRIDSGKILFKPIKEKIDNSAKTTINKAYNIITAKHFTNIITCSYSSAVINLSKEMKKHGFDIEIFAVNSLWNGKDYAESVKNECLKNNIKCNIISLNQIKNADVDCGIIGADSTIQGQGIMNGIPSLSLAEELNKILCPLYVMAESYKISEEKRSDEGFEFVSLSFIEEIVSDDIFNIEKGI